MRAVWGPETVSGLRMRANDPIFERMLQSAGAQTSRVPLPGMRSALEQGTLDGALMAYESYVSLQLADQLKFVTVGETHHLDGLSSTSDGNRHVGEPHQRTASGIC